MGWLFFGFAFWNKTNSHYARGINVFGKGFGDYRQDIVAQILWRMRILKFFLATFRMSEMPAKWTDGFFPDGLK